MSLWMDKLKMATEARRKRKNSMVFCVSVVHGSMEMMNSILNHIC